MQPSFLITFFHPLLKTTCYAATPECHRNFVTDRYQAQRFSSRRDAFAAAMAKAEAKLFPRNAEVEVVPMVLS